MNKVFLFCISCIFAIGIQAQTGHLKFMDIPMEGTLDSFTNRLIEEKGFIKSQMGKEDEQYNKHQIKLIGKFGSFENAKVYLKQHSKANGISSLTIHLDIDQYYENNIQNLVEQYTSLYGDPKYSYKSEESSYQMHMWNSENGDIVILVCDDYIDINYKDKTELDANEKDYEEYKEKRSKQTVNEICGIPFGSSYETAETMLDNKYGRAEYSNNNTLYYKNKTYAGISFDSMLFGFESDGSKSYMNVVVFTIDAKTLKEAKEKRDMLYTKLSYKYDIESREDDEGLKYYVGGYPPDNSYGLFQKGFVIDIMKRDKDQAKLYTPYVVRLYYGKYTYVIEDF